MEIRIVQGSITEVESDALIVNLFEGVTSPGGGTGAVDRALGGIITDLIASGEISGKLNKTALIHTQGKIAPKRVLVVGLGKSEDFDYIAAGKVSGTAARFLREKRARKVTTIVHGAGIGGLDAKDSARAVVEGAIIGLYDGDLYKTLNEDKPSDIEEFVIVERDSAKIAEFEAGSREGQVLASAANEVRDLANEPANRMTPVILAERTQEMAVKAGLEIEVLDQDRMAELGMGGLLGVAQGSTQPPRLIFMRYRGKEGGNTLALVGKGLTFDSGGISIKPSEGMQDMKYDMSGGAAVIGAMKAIAELKPAINVIGVVPASENMPGGSAYKPGDVIRFYNGKTTEVITTDAEGRMILADAITYAIKQGATHLIDIATLTGSCVVALGHDITGVMGNNREFTGRLMEAARLTGEKCWELPLPPEYKEQLKSEIADFKNIGTRWGGALTGGLFLKEFVEDLPWVHLDIAGTADSDAEEPYRAKGATGVGTRMLAMLAVLMSNE
ncbi:MAG TPA: leucyl aminopeptidase [Armatimonadota bacterium]|nr:leucyl aminopeptidase [Armatimonadota bacterium]